MKKITIIPRSKYLLTSVASLLLAIHTFAQENLEVNGHDVGSWFSKNWLWVTGAVVLLLIILLFSGGGRSSSKQNKTTTIVKDDLGNTKRVITTEVNEQH